MTTNRLYYINILVLFILFSPHNVLSAPPSTFDIQGFRLGDSFSEVKHKFPCQNPKIKISKYNEKISSIHVECDYEEDGLFTFLFGHDQKIQHVQKTFRFKYIEPDYDHIWGKIFSKYGTPKIRGEVQYKTKSDEEQHTMCWGACKLYDTEGNEYWTGSGVRHGDTGKSLMVKLSKNNGSFKAVFAISLFDATADKEQVRWYDKMEDEMIKKKSDIEF